MAQEHRIVVDTDGLRELVRLVLTQGWLARDVQCKSFDCPVCAKPLGHTVELLPDDRERLVQRTMTLLQSALVKKAEEARESVVARDEPLLWVPDHLRG